MHQKSGEYDHGPHHFIKLTFQSTSRYNKESNMALVKLPLFPLNIVVLPFEEVPLHIFEPRYKQMVKYSIAQGKPFGIVFKDDKNIDTLGCSVEITKVIKTYTSGEYDIVVTGKKRFKIMNRTKKEGLWIGNIEFFPDQAPIDSNLFKEIQDEYLKVLLKFGIEENLELHLNKKLSYEFVKGILLPISIKKKLLEIVNEKNRLSFIKSLFNEIQYRSPIPQNGQNIPEA